MRVVGALAAAGALALTGGPASAAACGPKGPPAYTCTSGDVPSGTYAQLKVTGACKVAAGAKIRVLGSVRVAAGAEFDAQSAPSTITVGRNVIGAKGSLVGLGCQPTALTGNSAHPCTDQPDGHSTITVFGNVRATDAAAVLLNGTVIFGNVTLRGGGSQIPWAIKNNTIGGDLTAHGQKTDWLGVLFNTVGRSVRLTDIALSDPDPGAPGVYIVRNTIGWDLVCHGLTPGVSGGFVPGSVNVVGHTATGQCASLV
ncbi:hypothetical protein [Allobranchiibius sp. CTAmp26]|uniref:hypothetical protein n=1 Tax=Allobranchiibius sp. CTAmp26 TaxID=2815214 RepID=UPI001AA13F15|nr:hypothetical protein [Allobranchiibius sp. CTAmp26]MBO1754388.1 hypothetical protein [Allobranchiibius sp. CTAmp26]